jgi:uncharacterized protein
MPIPLWRACGLVYADDVNCPKCHGRMMTFDRRGVHIDQCENCRGIFLDRGELEQIANAEQHHYGSAYGGHYSDSPGPHQGHRDSPGPFGGGYRDSPRPYGGHYRDSPPPHGRRRKRGFLEELFD